MNKAKYFVRNLISSILREETINTSNETHINKAMDWLLRAQKMTPDNGVSEGFHMYHGWLPSYPETTGYIIETFLNYADRTDNNHYKECAIKMADWLCAIQNSDGSIPDSSLKMKMVFDTGQVVFGFVKAFEVTENQKYINAAIKAANWIISVQEKNGSWIKYAAQGIPHTYYSRVAWSLLRVHKITNENLYIQSCKKNIEWCLRQQHNNGWFDNSSFNLKNHHRPFTHTIAYTIRGLLESGTYLYCEDYIMLVMKAMDNLALEINSSGFVSGTYNKYWKGDKRLSCLTGNAQLSIIFLKLAKLKKEKKYFEIGTRINNYLKSKQNISTTNLDIQGAIPGSYPIWGRYIHFTYPNWAAKFFIDALLLEKEFINEIE